MPRRSSTVSFAVPMSMPRYSCMASALTTSPPSASASASAEVRLAGRGGSDDRDDERHSAVGRAGSWHVDGRARRLGDEPLGHLAEEAERRADARRQLQVELLVGHAAVPGDRVLGVDRDLVLVGLDVDLGPEHLLRPLVARDEHRAQLGARDRVAPAAADLEVHLAGAHGHEPERVPVPGREQVAVVVRAVLRALRVQQARRPARSRAAAGWARCSRQTSVPRRVGPWRRRGRWWVRRPYRRRAVSAVTVQTSTACCAPSTTSSARSRASTGTVTRGAQQHLPGRPAAHRELGGQRRGPPSASRARASGPPSARSARSAAS